MAGGEAAVARRRFVPALDEAEIEAILFGLSLLLSREAEEGHAEAAATALEKIGAALPPPPEEPMPHGPGIRAAIERAIRTETRLGLRYGDREGAVTERIVWPLDIGFFEAAEVVIAWCETRRDFRHFRLDRAIAARPTELRYPVRQRILLARWHAQAEERA